MFGFFKKLFPAPSVEFFTLFEDAAKNCAETARLFQRINDEGLNEELLEEARKLKHESSAVTEAILHQLNNTFITPIDREDIQNLANLLNRITRKIVKACFNMRSYRVETATDNMQEQDNLLAEATMKLLPLVSLIRNVSQTGQAMKLHSEMQELETQGDMLMDRTLENLFSGNLKALEVLKYREIHKGIEGALDLCYHVSSEILSIMLKHS
jgi:uncharacterized protein Yka (UPF0111/DUF47 family)